MEQYDASVVVCICTLAKGCTHISSAWGVYSVHFVGLVFGDTTFLMNSIEFLTLFNNGKPAATGEQVQAHYKHTNCGI